MQVGLRERLGAEAPGRLYSQPRQMVATPNFLYVVDGALSLPAAPWISEQGYLEAFALARESWQEVEGDTVQALMVLTTFDEGGNSLFYTPLANDVRGLGVGKATELFDDTPGSRLEGVIWMGPYAELEEAGSAYLEEAFVHEIAHRWLAYAELDAGLLARDALRGRQSSHWSFLYDTDRSPMEGNRWQVEGRRRIARVDPSPPRFSALDLYFMGVALPEEVGASPLITAYGSVEPNWVAVAPGATPAHRLGVDVSLEVLTESTIDLAMIVRGSGARSPPPTQGPVTWRVGVVFLSNGLARAEQRDLARLDARLHQLIEVFRDATWGRMEVDLALATAGHRPLGEACAAVSECDRSQAELCAGGPGQEAICTRPCASDSDCGADLCCSPSAQLCALSCESGPDPDRPGTDAGPTIDPGAGPDDLLESAPGSCGCRGVGTRPAGGWGFSVGWALGLGGLGWARRRHRPIQT